MDTYNMNLPTNDVILSTNCTYRDQLNKELKGNPQQIK